MWWLLGAVGLVILARVLSDWGWQRGYRRADEDINKLPKRPGVYILHFPGLGGSVYVGSTKNLRRRLQEHRQAKPGWSRFDWYQTHTLSEAQKLERRLHAEVNRLKKR